MNAALLGIIGMALGFGLAWALLAAKLERARRELTKAEAKREALEERLAESGKLKEQSELIFENTANKLFESFSNKFTVQSEKKIGDLLNPLRERLTEFQKKVDDSFSTQGKEQHSLKNEIEKIARMNDSLTKALRGDVKAQGNWGEIMLERILEASGLRAGEDYIVQGNEMNLSGAGGNRLRPDVIVRLPDSKHIIIDAKVSLTAYDRYCSNPEEIHLKDFLKSVRAHVAGLESKRYQDLEKLGTPDFVFMFMPIEGAFSFAMQHDPELQHFAWGKGIIIVPPTNLFANLRTVASLWNIERQNKNAQEIARQGGALYDKFVGFVEDLQGVGTQMKRAQGSLDQAMNKLSTGTGNLISRAEKLRTLGAKPAKSLPSELIENKDNVIALASAEES